MKCNEERDSRAAEQDKPGSVHKQVNHPHDFGISPDKTSEVRYASNATLNQDKGRLQARSSEEQGGRRDVGVGVNAGGVGAGSGGDIDTDIVGVGTSGSGIANSPDPDAIQRPESTRGGADGATRNAATPIDDQGLTGADAIRTDAEDPFQDATAGEISSDESNGTDNDEGVDVDENNA